MRVAIVGAGATGGFLGARLAQAGEDVTLIARGAHLAAMRERGLTVLGADGEFTAHPRCTDDLEAVRTAEVVFVTVKAHQLVAVAPQLGSVLAPGATLVSAQNGIPWWYFHREGGRLDGEVLEAVDPGGLISRSISMEQVVGCIVYPATELSEPGVVRHVEGTRLTIGEPDGSRSERCEAISAALGRAGLKGPISARIRQELWLKLLGNATLNPVSALTGATLARMATGEESRALIGELMAEVESVARALGIDVQISIDKRLDGAREVGEHKTSMLQDVEAGKPIEIDALVGSVVELGRRLAVPTPRLDVIYRLGRLLNSRLEG